MKKIKKINSPDRKKKKNAIHLKSIRYLNTIVILINVRWAIQGGEHTNKYAKSSIFKNQFTDSLPVD